MSEIGKFSKTAKAFYNMDNNFPGKSVNVTPIIGAALAAAMTNPIGTIGTAMGEGSQLANDLGAATSTAAASQSAGLFSIPQKNNQNNLVYPKSGINFVLYNSRFDVVDENTGYLPVDDNINAIQNLASDRLVMKESGYFEVFVNNDAQTPVYYDNLRVGHSACSVLEVNAYYPYGKLIAGLSEQSTYAKNRYKYNEKEYIEELDLNWSDFGERMLDIQWMVADPLAEDYYSTSPYAYVANNPINAIDPDGRSIWVIITPNGIQVIGGDDDDDDIYVGHFDKDKKFIREKSIGKSLTMNSFFGEDGKAIEGTIISQTDNTGIDFLNNEIIAGNPTLFEYMKNARNGELFDFKNRGIESPDEMGMSTEQYHYRGMPLYEVQNIDGSVTTVYGSARDVGNVAAGFVAGRKGLSWNAARFGFDAYQSWSSKKITRESQVTQRAQNVGWGIAIFGFSILDQKYKK